MHCSRDLRDFVDDLIDESYQIVTYPLRWGMLLCWAVVVFENQPMIDVHIFIERRELFRETRELNDINT